MAPVFEQLFVTSGDLIAWNPSADIFYLVTGAADETAVAAAAPAGTAASYRGMPRRWTRIEEHINETTWRVQSHYEPYTRTPPSDTFTFSTRGGNQHITSSLEVVGAYAPPTKTAPTINGAIGWDGLRVCGVDIEVPIFNFTETHVKNSTDVDQAYKLAVHALTAHVNDDTFRGFDIGEVFFRGADGSQREGGDWSITYEFSASPNLAGLEVGSITGIAKGGWQFLDVRYVSGLSQSCEVPVPLAAYVHRLFYSGNFDDLEI